MEEKKLSKLHYGLIITHLCKSLAEDVIGNTNEEFPLDFSDIGNTIGIVIGEELKNCDDIMGCDKESFMHGLKHGLSLIDKTH